MLVDELHNMLNLFVHYSFRRLDTQSNPITTDISNQLVFRDRLMVHENQNQSQAESNDLDCQYTKSIDMLQYYVTLMEPPAGINIDTER